MKTTLVTALTVLMTTTLSGQDSASPATNRPPAQVQGQSPVLPEFNFIEAAETVRAIAAEAGTIDRQKYLQTLQKRSATILSELKPMVEQMRPARTNAVPPAAVNSPPAEAAVVAPLPESVTRPTPDARMARLESQVRLLAAQLDVLKRRVEQLQNQAEKASK
ncbi:MAG: hypothetical protein HY735_03545 [Verrucomicrobia bacterium]|nr:hypothetical protein [Verrucomicrobiota bacterium]